MTNIKTNWYWLKSLKNYYTVTWNRKLESGNVERDNVKDYFYFNFFLSPDTMYFWNTTFCSLVVKYEWILFTFSIILFENRTKMPWQYFGNLDPYANHAVNISATFYWKLGQLHPAESIHSWFLLCLEYFNTQIDPD